MSRPVTIVIEDTAPIFFGGEHFMDMTFSGTADVIRDPSRAEGFRLVHVEVESFDTDGLFWLIEPDHHLFESFEAYCDRHAEAVRRKADFYERRAA